MTACGPTLEAAPPPAPIIRERLIGATPDPALRHCQDRPGRPTLRDSADEAVLIARLDERGVDCAAKLAATWQSIDDTTRQVAEANAETPDD